MATHGLDLEVTQGLELDLRPVWVATHGLDLKVGAIHGLDLEAEKASLDGKPRMSVRIYSTVEYFT